MKISMNDKPWNAEPPTLNDKRFLNLEVSIDVAGCTVEVRDGRLHLNGRDLTDIVCEWDLTHGSRLRLVLMPSALGEDARERLGMVITPVSQETTEEWRRAVVESISDFRARSV